MAVKPVSSVQPHTLTPSEFRQFKVIGAALYWYRRRDQIWYSNVRGQELKKQFRKPPFVPTHIDCSAFVTCCYYVAGCPDPNNAAYAGEIHTGSLWRNGRLIGGPNVKSGLLEPGDLIFYGYNYPEPMHGGNSEHVTVYIDDDQCISMGSDEGPKLLPWNEGSNKPLFGVRRYKF